MLADDGVAGAQLDLAGANLALGEAQIFLYMHEQQIVSPDRTRIEARHLRREARSFQRAEHGIETPRRFRMAAAGGVPLADRIHDESSHLGKLETRSSKFETNSKEKKKEKTNPLALIPFSAFPSV